MPITAWVESQERFCNQERCVLIGRILDRLEGVEDREIVHAARAMHLFLGVIVDQLVKARADYAAPSLFQRLALSSFMNDGLIHGRRIAQLIETARGGLCEAEGNIFAGAWAFMCRLFVVRPNEVDIVSNIVQMIPTGSE